MGIFYHVTTVKRFQKIKNQGLKSDAKHNVRISKDVVYVMSDLVSAGIFASKMSWEMQEDVVILKLSLNNSLIKNDENIGAYDTWKEYHGDIAKKNIVKVMAYDSDFKKAHVKRFQDRVTKGVVGSIRV